MDKLSTDSPTFAEDFKKARVAKGFSLKSLAEKANISTSMTGRYESGAAKPSAKTLFELNNILCDEETKAVTIESLSTDELIRELKRRGAVEIKF